MDPAILHKILMSFRGPQEAMASPMSQAPMGAPGLDQAYTQPMAPSMQQAQEPSPIQYNPMLEQQAQGMNNQLEPIVQQIMKHLGMMGMIRNRSNQTMVDPYSQG